MGIADDGVNGRVGTMAPVFVGLIVCGVMAVVSIAPIPAQCAGDFNPDPAHRSA